MIGKTIAPFVVSLVVITFGILFHLLKVTPHNWAGVAMWLPIYISPIWAITGLNWLSERKKLPQEYDGETILEVKK